MASDSHTTHVNSRADNERSVQLAHHNAAASGCVGLDMLLSPEPEQTGGLGMDAMQQRLAQMHASWHHIHNSLAIPQSLVIKRQLPLMPDR